MVSKNKIWHIYDTIRVLRKRFVSFFSNIAGGCITGKRVY